MTFAAAEPERHRRRGNHGEHGHWAYNGDNDDAHWRWIYLSFELLK